MNVSHLELGTQADNVSDSIARGRFHRGETSGHAKLSNADVIDIRLRNAAGDMSSDIASRYGIDPSTVSNILTGRTWAHVK